MTILWNGQTRQSEKSFAFNNAIGFVKMFLKTSLFFLSLWTSEFIAIADEIDLAKLKAQLIQHEGKRSKVYKDTEGIPTIAVGFNLTRSDAKSKMEAMGLDYRKILSGDLELNEAQIESLLSADIEAAIADAISSVKVFDKLSDVRKRVVVDMVFNLGKTRFLKFVNMIAALEKRDFDTASKEMTDAKWCKQVKTRCTTLVAMMKSGSDPK